MESTKKSENVGEDKSNLEYQEQTSPPIEERFEKLWPGSSGSHLDPATVDFTPQDHGREQTLTYLYARTPESLMSVLSAREQAEKTVRRGPQTKGTKEVQLILSEPSCKAVSQLHHVKGKAELAARFGKTGIVLYNLRKSLASWTSTSRLPSLQLRIPKPHMRVTYDDCNVLPETLTACPPSPPISEPGGWRDCEQASMANWRFDFTSERRLSDGEGDIAVSEEEEEVEGEFGAYIDAMPATPSRIEGTDVEPAWGSR
ncbi:hypothetical protein F4802DRAFT_248466 [Xylaria palmicola]|nr:hypothetical protein F4802DRAFT_248466 [Xylaria palmicola]